MNIKSVESLKTWLSAKLEPICDADPAALAKYVLALLKKNKSDEQLKELCIDQLEVFLSSETKHFVEKLFDALATESYILAETTTATAKESPVGGGQVSSASGRTFVERTERIPSPPPPDLLVSSVPRDRRPSEDFSRRESIIDDDDRDFKRTKRDRDRDRDSPRHRSPQPMSGAPSRSRQQRPTSPISVISTINSMPRSRGWGERERHPYRRRDEDPRRRRHRDEEERRPPRFEEKEHVRGLRNVHERLGPRSDGLREESNLVSVVTTALSDDEEEDGKLEKEKEKEEKVGGGEESKSKCRDYEDKGFCVQGDQCLFEHGNAVVMEDGSHSSNRLRAGGFLPRRAMHPMMNPRHMHPGMMRRHADQFSPNGYNPEAPSFDGQQLPPPLPHWGPPIMPMPPMPGGFGPRFGPRGFMGPYRMPVGPRFDRKRPRDQRGDRDRDKDKDRDGLGSDKLADKEPGSSDKDDVRGDQMLDGDEKMEEKQKLTSTLLLKKVPSHLNNISKLNGYFQRFGTIVNMQVGVLGDPESALIQFSSHGGAKRAHDCPEAVFNNRFIKVFWYKDEMGTGTIKSVAPSRGGPPSKMPRVSPLSLTSNRGPEGPEEVSPTGKPVGRKSLPSPGSLSLSKIKLVMPLTPRPRKDMVQKNLELQKQKQALMAKQLEQQRRLISMLEKNKKLSREDKAKVMQTLKSLSINISSLKDSVTSGTEAAVKQAASVSQSNTPRPTAATPEGAHDKLDVSTVGHEEREGGGTVGVDLSPKAFERQQRQVVVSNFQAGSLDDLTEHISDFAAVEDITVTDDDTSSYLVTFKSRKDAEIVMAHGGVYKAKPLSMDWYKGQRQKERTTSVGDGDTEASANPPAVTRESVDDETELLAEADEKDEPADVEELEYEEEEMPPEEEEEEEEEESRSWRRR